MIQMIHMAVDMFLHLDTHLKDIIGTYGALTYVLLFVIIFCETGLVVTPFLPGDSLLFIAGSLSAFGSLNVAVLFITLALAAIIGDSVNYWIGSILGKKVFHEKQPSGIFKNCRNCRNWFGWPKSNLPSIRARAVRWARPACFN